MNQRSRQTKPWQFRQPKFWRTTDQKYERTFKGRKETLIKTLMAINKLPDTRFGFYGERNGKWMKFEPDEKFALDTGVKIRTHDSFGLDNTAPTPPLSFQEQPPHSPVGLIVLTEDIFGDD